MGFGEFMGLAVVMTVVFVVFPAVVFNGIARVKAAKARAGGAGDALRMSELNSIIDEAVRRETAALRARIEVLEEIATSRHDDYRLLEAAPPAVALPEADEEADVASAARRSSTRA